MLFPDNGGLAICFKESKFKLVGEPHLVDFSKLAVKESILDVDFYKHPNQAMFVLLRST
jgi:hypothetical protein